MISRNATKKPKFSRLFVALVLMMTAIILIIAIISGLISANAIKHETSAASVYFLNKLSKLLENDCASIDRLIVQFGSNPANVGILDHIDAAQNKYALYKNIREQLIRSYDYIDSIYFYLNGGESVFFISAGSGSCDLVPSAGFFDKEAYRSFLQAGSRATMLPARLIEPNYYGRAAKESECSRVVSFITGLPAFSTNSREAIQFNIDEAHFLRLISSDYTPERSVILVLDQNGGVLLSCGQQEGSVLSISAADAETVRQLAGKASGSPLSASLEFGGVKSYITLLRPESCSRIYAVICPDSVLYRPVYTVNYTLIASSVIILLIGAILSFLIDRRFYRPALLILQKIRVKRVSAEGQCDAAPLRQETQNSDAFAEIEGYIDDIVTKSNEQERLLQRYFSGYKQRVLLSLMKDGRAVQVPGEDHVLISPEYRYICVMIIRRVQAPAALPDMDANLADEIRPDAGNKVRIETVPMDRGKTALLLFAEAQPSQADLRSLANAVAGRNRAETPCAVAVGPVCAVADIRLSYIESERTLNRHANESGIFLTDGAPDANAPRVRYPADMEARLTAEIASGDMAKAVCECENFYTYLREQGCDTENLVLYTAILANSISKQLAKYKKGQALFIEAAYSEIAGLSSIEEMEAWIKQILNTIDHAGNSEAYISNKELIEKVVNYVNMHYAEDIGLNIIADYVYLSPSYLGKIFKDLSGLTFTDYLIRVRMDNAKDLLLNKNISVNDVSRKVGYYSVQSFCRLFKKHYGCSPGEYRRKRAENDLDA